MRAIIFANGVLEHPDSARRLAEQGDLIIAADGGSHHCRTLGIIPHVIIGDLDSMSSPDLEAFHAAGTEILRYPSRKDFTDLELALQYARDQGAQEVYVLAALGARWDQTLANMLLPATRELSSLRIRLVDGPQEIFLLHEGGKLEVKGASGDIVSLVPLGGDAAGITTQGLEYALENERLIFGATRGISNLLTQSNAFISLQTGMLLCVVIHLQEE